MLLPLHTRWLTEDDDLTLTLKEAIEPWFFPGDTVAISEKVVVLLTGRSVGIPKPGLLARFLASHVRPLSDSKGLANPAKMEYVVQTIGLPRILLAAIGAGFARSLRLGKPGMFYRIAGPIARDVDGGRPPYEHTIFPPLDEAVAQAIAIQLEWALGLGVAIVDLNDFGGSIRAVSEKSLDPETLMTLLSDNPAGQRLTSTPFVLVRA